MTAQVLELLLVAHFVHLESEIFAPILQGFHLSHHMSQFLTNHRLLDELLAEGLTLVGPTETEVNNAAVTLNDTTSDHPAFMIEIGHNDLEAQVLFAEKVFNGDFDIVELDVGGSGHGRVTGLDNAGRDA